MRSPRIDRWLVFRPHANGRVEAAPEAAAARVSVVERGSVSHVLALAGQFQPYQGIDVHPKVSGFIRSIKVDIGDRVRQGQTLAVLEVPELQANTAYQRISVTAELLEQANMGLKLAQTRYQLGLSSIVELTQAQLQQTSAAIDKVNAQYEYDLALATLDYQIGTTP
jgi:multidrug efflux pump subunit AcrA (membrane-fusion protein)